MKYSGFTLAFLVVSAVAKVHGSIPGYRIVDLEWEVETTPGGPTAIFNGTIEKVFNQLTDANPKFYKEYSLSSRDVEAPHTQYTQDWFFCRGRWGSKWHGAHAYDIGEGIRYLRGVKGKPTRNPGPGSCGRVSCSFGAAIWWCNDHAEQFTLDSFSNIADAAKVLIDNCAESPSWLFRPRVSGQIFYREGWNVIVTEDDCSTMTLRELQDCYDRRGCIDVKWKEVQTRVGSPTTGEEIPPPVPGPVPCKDFFTEACLHLRKPPGPFGSTRVDEKWVNDPLNRQHIRRK